MHLIHQVFSGDYPLPGEKAKAFRTGHTPQPSHPATGMSVAVPRPLTMPTPKPAPSASSSAPKQAIPRAAPRIAPPLPGKDLSSSTGKIFAKPSKEWVLPERAKPGRKAATDEPDNKRQSQNRLSQRAHRARRTDYIATLEQRLRQYEQDEIHSNVRLQEVARALKQDNEKLKAEVGRLNAAVGSLRAERDAWTSERRALNDTIKQLRGGRISTSPTTPYAPTPRSIGIATPVTQPSRATVACPICPDPDPDCPCQQPAPLQSQDPTLAPLPPITASSPSTTSRNAWNVEPSNCGFCDLAPEACLCRDIKPVISRSPSPIGDCGLCTNDSFCACRAGAAAAASSPASKSIPLKSLLAAALPGPSMGIATSSIATTTVAPAPAASIQIASAAVPLKRKAKADRIQSVWTLSNVKARTARTEAVCTGDPSNCDACRNDTFGREFCGHLFNRPHECNGGCASSSSSTGSGSGSGVVEDGGVVKTSCCGAPELCGQHSDCSPPAAGSGPDESAGSGSGSGSGGPDTIGLSEEHMRPDLAWRTLKAHPNAKFAPLAMLADVVARRHKVRGPRVELSPSPPPPTMREIQTSAVKDALRWLDGQKRGAEEEGQERDGKRRRMWQ